MLRRMLSVLSGNLFFLVVLLPGLPASAQREKPFTMPAARFSVDRRSHATLTPFAGGVRIRPTTRDDLFVSAIFQLPAGRSEVTRVVVHFRTDKLGDAALTSVQVSDPQSGDILKAETRASGDLSSLVKYKPATTANAWMISTSKPPKTIGAGTTIRLGIAAGVSIDGGEAGEPFDLISVDVFVKDPLKVQAPSTSANLNSAIGPGVTGSTPAPPAPVASIPDIPHSKGVIYTVNDAHELIWYRHDGRADGSFRWAAPTGSRVGIGWNFRTVLGGGDGVIYAINAGGDLIWYRHDGGGDGSFRWAQSEGRTVNSGFRNTQVVAAGHGVLYALNRAGDLMWFRHDGYADGTDRWLAREGRVIGSNWPRVRLFAGDAGTLYAITPAHDLYRFHYDGHADGSGLLPFEQGQKIASDWDYLAPFSAGDGILYAVNAQHQLLWFHDEGYLVGTVHWENTEPKVVGVGWQFQSIFSGALLQP